MDDFMRDYVEAMIKNHKFIPMVPLGETVSLGDLLLLKKDGRKGMKYMGNIADPAIGVPLTPGADETPGDQDWSSTSEITLTVKAQGATPEVGSSLPQARAGISVTFSKNRAFLFQARAVRYNRIENLVSVRKELTNKLTNGLFGSDEIWFVTHVATVGSYALAISNSKNARWEVSANANAGSLGLADLVRTDLGLEIASKNGLGFQDLGTTGGSLFFRAEKMLLPSRLPAGPAGIFATAASRPEGDGMALPQAVVRTPGIGPSVISREVTVEDLAPSGIDTRWSPNTLGGRKRDGNYGLVDPITGWRSCSVRWLGADNGCANVQALADRSALHSQDGGI